MTAGIGAADAAIYTGVCQENDDPTNEGRIKYCVPQLSGTAGFGWAIPVYPGYTAVGANVYVAFEGGDRNRPIFWPDQTPLQSYPTFATMTAAQPLPGAPVGSEFYIADHGGNVQLQNTGVTSTSTGWQYLPNGYQGSSVGGVQVYVGVPSGSKLNQVTINNPSAKRIYKITADVGSYFNTPDSTNVFAAGLGIVVSTTAPTATQVNGYAYDYLISDFRATPDTGSGVIHNWLNLAYTKTGLTPGLIYIASYLVYINPDDTPNLYTYPSTGGNRNLLVEDIGAQA